jgi:undecaprenyl phosphate-alpha-L-ara4FN deformylase
MGSILVGLRIDVDTFRGTKYGVPKLCKILDEFGIKSSIFFTVGPDNMGRNIWRLTSPTFLHKMFRTNGVRLYGWSILFRGFLFPGPLIGEKLSSVIRAASDAGHEIGLHGWDHYMWQSQIDKMDENDISQQIKKGVDVLAKILGYPPTCSAVPAWKCSDFILSEKNKLSFEYNSDCRGESVFVPVIRSGKEISQPQIPVTLPTYDEVIGHNGISNSNYNDYILSLIKPEKLNILTVHAEKEGIVHSEMFFRFIEKACLKDIHFVPLSKFLLNCETVNRSIIVKKEIHGRDGWVSCQSIL